MDLTSINWIDRNAILTIVIGKKANRRKGYGTEALTLLLEHAFKSVKLPKVELNVYDENAAAIHCYKRNGFRSEGKRRDHMLGDGSYHDLIQMGILESEFLHNVREFGSV